VYPLAFCENTTVTSGWRNSGCWVSSLWGISLVVVGVFSHGKSDADVAQQHISSVHQVGAGDGVQFSQDKGQHTRRRVFSQGQNEYTCDDFFDAEIKEGQ